MKFLLDILYCDDNVKYSPVAVLGWTMLIEIRATKSMKSTLTSHFFNRG